jgi:hypothetical protein
MHDSIYLRPLGPRPITFIAIYLSTKLFNCKLILIMNIVETHLMLINNHHSLDVN